jgi:hypothetical protein
MPGATKPDHGGLNKLTEILERAVAANADAVEFEYDSAGDLEVCFLSGNSGLGMVLDMRERPREVIAAIAKVAKMRSFRGKMRMKLLGQDYTIRVERRQHFDDWAWRLTFDQGARSMG